MKQVVILNILSLNFISYVLQRGWIEKEGQIPSYEDIVGVEDSEEELEEAEEFERKYNFRHEEE